MSVILLGLFIQEKKRKAREAMKAQMEASQICDPVANVSLYPDLCFARKRWKQHSHSKRHPFRLAPLLGCEPCFSSTCARLRCSKWLQENLQAAAWVAGMTSRLFHSETMSCIIRIPLTFSARSSSMQKGKDTRRRCRPEPSLTSSLRSAFAGQPPLAGQT